MEIKIINNNKKGFLDLLLLADEQESMIDKYLERGELFALYDGGLKSVCVVTKESDDTCELKNIATYEKWHGKGYGSKLLKHVSSYYKGKYETMLVGTGDSPWILRFYQKNGFEITHRIKNFFTDNYDHPMFEDGVQLVDMVYLSKALGKILETERLILREMTLADISDLSKILQDDEVMYAYEGAFSDAEVRSWLENQLMRYQKYGFGLWAVILKDTGEMIGQCGLTMQAYNNSEVMEIGYLFRKEYWHQGYASEAAIACKKYAFDTLHANEVYSIIRDTNIPSQNVAKRNGMTYKDSFVKHYRGIDMPHYVYSAKRSDEE